MPERQRIYQADPRPVYLRAPASKLMYGIFLGFFWTGIAGITIGTFNQIRVRNITVSKGRVLTS